MFEPRRAGGVSLDVVALTSWEIVGRETEIAAVRRFVAGPAPAALVLEGEAGCGKTR